MATIIKETMEKPRYARLNELDELGKRHEQALHSREAALTDELAIANKQLALLPGLREKFDTLVAEHASSKQRYTTTSNQLRSRAEDLEKKLKSSQAAEARSSAESLAKGREVGRLGDELGRVRSLKGEVEQKLRDVERDLVLEKERTELAKEIIQECRAHTVEVDRAARRQATQLCAQASSFVSILDSQHESASSSKQVENVSLQYQIARLERKLLEKQDQVDQLVDLVVCMEDEKAVLEDRAADFEADLDSLHHQIRLERSASHIVEKRLLRSTAEALEEVEVLRSQHLQDMQEWRIDREIRLGQREELDLQLEELREKSEEAEGLHQDVHRLKNDLRDREDELDAAHDMLLEKERECDAKQESINASEARIDALEEELRSAEDTRASLEADLKNQQEQRRRLASMLTASQTSESQLQEQVEDLTSDLVNYAALQETHEELLKTLDRLMRTADLAEEDANQLAQLNAQLIGHNNPSQRIRHMDKVRNELAGLKKKHIAVQAELSAALRNIENLQVEIATYRAVDGASVATNHMAASKQPHYYLKVSHPSTTVTTSGLLPQASQELLKASSTKTSTTKPATSAMRRPLAAVPHPLRQSVVSAGPRRQHNQTGTNKSGEVGRE